MQKRLLSGGTSVTMEGGGTKNNFENWDSPGWGSPALCEINVIISR